MLGEPDRLTFVVAGMCATDIGADLPEFVQVREVGQPRAPETRKPAPERGPLKEGKTDLRRTRKDMPADGRLQECMRTGEATRVPFMPGTSSRNTSFRHERERSR